MITIQRERASEVVEEIVPLLVSHWKEVNKDLDVPNLNPDFSVYLDADDQGMLVVLTVRDDGKLIGYAVDNINYNTRYQMDAANNDIMYVSPDYRHTNTFKDLNTAMEQELRKMGIQLRTMKFKTKEKKPNSLGYLHIENTYFKRLK